MNNVKKVIDGIIYVILGLILGVFSFVLRSAVIVVMVIDYWTFKVVEKVIGKFGYVFDAETIQVNKDMEEYLLAIADVMTGIVIK